MRLHQEIRDVWITYQSKSSIETVREEWDSLCRRHNLPILLDDLSDDLFFEVVQIHCYILLRAKLHQPALDYFHQISASCDAKLTTPVAKIWHLSMLSRIHLEMKNPSEALDFVSQYIEYLKTSDFQWTYPDWFYYWQHQELSLSLCLCNSIAMDQKLGYENVCLTLKARYTINQGIFYDDLDQLALELVSIDYYVKENHLERVIEILERAVILTGDHTLKTPLFARVVRKCLLSHLEKPCNEQSVSAVEREIWTFCRNLLDPDSVDNADAEETELSRAELILRIRSALPQSSP